ncbi:acyclic terpene utilization AtuA family protein [Xenophilus aerolatus]|nr:DUF1446 domain-containing protein [Xenophilus aerolatus]
MTAPTPRPPARRTVRIGGASGFWGDSSVAAGQLVRGGAPIDYLVFDYLAETTMAVLAGARLRKPEMGWATDFVEVAMRDVLADCVARRIRVVSNAGGVHPEACAEALRALAREQGVDVRVAVVLGDDVSGQLPALHADGVQDMASGEPVPARALSANAYLGAQGIRAALAAGADVVVTGRCVDSAVTLGPLLHEFAWADDDWDRIAGGSLAGHIIECGCQATGGLHTDWQAIPDWPGIGYPIVEVAEDGSFTLGKPPGTGGAILRAAVAEQLLYEIGDPAAYLLPDVRCDFTQVRIEQVDAQAVRVHGARGGPPPTGYKVSATVLDGWRCAAAMVIVGREAAAKAHRTAQAILARTRSLFGARGLADYTATYVEVLGTESVYGPHARAGAAEAREVLMRVVVDHADRKALELFAREIAPAGTSWSPGTTAPGSMAGRPPVVPLIKPFAFVLPRDAVAVRVLIEGDELPPAAAPALQAPTGPAPVAPPEAVALPADAVELPLIALAWARSGDKGDLANIGVVARRPEWLPWLWAALTPEAVAEWFGHLMTTRRVERFHLPGIHALNLLLHGALAGGGPRSPRLDPLGKGMAQMLLDMPVKVPPRVAAQAAEDAGLANH